MPHTGPILEGKGDSDYERYVRVPELLELVKPIDKLSNPEERLFQVMHQSAELWLHQLPGYLLELLADFDHVFVGASHAVEEVARISGRVVHCWPLRLIYWRSSSQIGQWAGAPELAGY